MSLQDNGYKLRINRGHSPINDRIFDFLKEKIGNRDFVDIGGNSSVLQRELGKGLCVDACKEIIDKNNDDGIQSIHADAIDLPFDDKTFEVSILSCVLQQIEDWRKALEEAKRVSKEVLIITPWPDKSQWGIKGNPWVKSVIDPSEFEKVEDLDGIHYFVCLTS